MVLDRSDSSTADEAVVAAELYELKTLISNGQTSFEEALGTLQEHSRQPKPEKAIEAVEKAFEAAVAEVVASAACSEKLYEILLARMSRPSLPRTSPRTTSIGPYGTRIERNPEDDIWSHKPSRIFEPGVEVAALVDEHSEPNLWILASVQRFDPIRKRYTVVDEDPGDDKNPEPVRKTYVLDATRVLSLPTLQQYPISKRIEFQKDESVLAIYPKTTVFYPARVLSGPRKLKHPYYLLQFQDDQGLHRKVQAHHVVPLPMRYYLKDPVPSSLC